MEWDNRRISNIKGLGSTKDKGNGVHEPENSLRTKGLLKQRPVRGQILQTGALGKLREEKVDSHSERLLEGCEDLAPVGNGCRFLLSSGGL